MANFSLDNSEIARAALQEMGVGRNASVIDPATEADLRAVMRSGLRRFYFPVVGDAVYQWRWLEKYFSVPTVDTFHTGTVAVTGGVVTLTGGAWPAGMSGYFIVVDGHVLFTTADAVGATVAISHTTAVVTAGATFVAYKYRYALPADFGEWLGGVVYDDGSNSFGSRTLARSDESEIRLRYAVGQGQNSNRTTHYALSSAPDATAAISIMFWPVPILGKFIQGVYLAVPDDNLPADLTVPGNTVQVKPIYAEAVMECVMWAAEEYNHIVDGPHAQRAISALQIAIVHDKNVGGAYDFSRPIDGRQGCGNVLPIDFSPQL